jgi:hypothetical protein
MPRDFALELIAIHWRLELEIVGGAEVGMDKPGRKI